MKTSPQSQMAGNLKLGVDYYPEQWPVERWETDAQMMAALGLSYVRVGEFAWSLLEPEEGRFSFGWLEQAINTLHAHGLQVILGTPTPTPPPWLTSRYDIFQRDENRLVRAAGSRRHACANNPDYQAHSDRIVTALASHFGQHQAVIGWQTDNEFSCHRTTWCYCDHCHRAFQQWLQARYDTLEALNSAWGTIFWSAIYTDWAQIPLPWASPAQQNPGLQLDFRRFASDSWVRFQKRQIDILRPAAPGRFITHNYMGLSEGGVDQIDYFDLADDLDFVSWDNYPQGKPGPHYLALSHDLMRGFKGKNYWVMEQQPGVVNWDRYNRPVPPGQVRLWTYQGFGHGADAVLYFRWRAARFGQEQYHMGVLKQDGSPTRLYEEAGQMTAELARLPAFTRRPAEVAMLFDYADWWSLQIDPHQGDFSYLQLVLDLYRQLWAAGIPVDILRRNQSGALSSYRVVIVPAPILISTQESQSWHAYVEAGGRLLVTFRAFAKEAGNVWTDRPLPAHLQDLLGVTVTEYLGLPPDLEGHACVPGAAENYRYRLWAETLAPKSGVPLMVYNDSHYWSGQAAVTQQTLGKGVAATLGCWFDPPIPPPVWQALGLSALAPGFKLPNLVESVPLRFEEGGEGLMLLNHNQDPAVLELPHKFVDLLAEGPEKDRISLEPLSVAILRFSGNHKP